MLLESCYRNTIGNCGNRYTEELLLTSAYLFLRTGAQQYTFFSQNAHLPSVNRIREFIMKDIQKMKEGELNFDGLLKYLEENGFEKEVAIVEDATKIIESVELDFSGDFLTGLTAPYDFLTGLPYNDYFIADSFDNIRSAVTNFNKSGYVNIILAVANSTNAVPFLLGYFGTDNRFESSHVLARVRYMKKELSSRGINLICFGSDGDSRYLHTQKVLINFGVQINFGPLELYGNIDPECLSNQDGLHLAKKLKNCLFQPSHYLQIGKFKASFTHLKILSTLFGKEQHGLNVTDLNCQDKMNYKYVSIYFIYEFISYCCLIIGALIKLQTKRSSIYWKILKVRVVRLHISS